MIRNTRCLFDWYFFTCPLISDIKGNLFTNLSIKKNINFRWYMFEETFIWRSSILVYVWVFFRTISLPFIKTNVMSLSVDIRSVTQQNAQLSGSTDNFLHILITGKAVWANVAPIQHFCNPFFLSQLVYLFLHHEHICSNFVKCMEII